MKERHKVKYTGQEAGVRGGGEYLFELIYLLFLD